MADRTLACPYPETVNPLSPNGFRFSIARIPEVTYFIQEVALPEISLPAVDQMTPFVRAPTTGDIPEFEELRIQFLVDSMMNNYRALFNWIRGLGFPEKNPQYTAQVKDGRSRRMSENASASSDATLSILGNTNNVIQTVNFRDCFITSLSTLNFTSTASDVQYLIGAASFRYTLYDFS